MFQGGQEIIQSQRSERKLQNLNLNPRMKRLVGMERSMATESQNHVEVEVEGVRFCSVLSELVLHQRHHLLHHPQRPPLLPRLATMAM